MTNNLPPGCNSPDGGLDPAMETATETLCDAVRTPEVAYALTALAPILEALREEAFRAAIQDERLIAGMQVHAVAESAFDQRKRTGGVHAPLILED